MKKKFIVSMAALIAILFLQVPALCGAYLGIATALSFTGVGAIAFGSVGIFWSSVAGLALAGPVGVAAGAVVGL
jgi:hypothetical protein